MSEMNRAAVNAANSGKPETDKIKDLEKRVSNLEESVRSLTDAIKKSSRATPEPETEALKRVMRG